VSMRLLGRLLVLALSCAFVYWIAVNTAWVETTVYRSARGDALKDPFYGAEHLARALGAHAVFDRLWALPPANGVIVMSYWNWSRNATQLAQLQRWVESGGRLVTDGTIDNVQLSHWTGVSRRYLKQDGVRRSESKPDGCREESESGFSLWPPSATPRRYELCGLFIGSVLVSRRDPVWKVADESGARAMRVKVGSGSVTLVNGVLFGTQQFLKSDHPAMFVAATQLHAGDEIHFVTDEDRPSLLALAWQVGAPVISLLLVALALGLWRALPRFGPVMASPDAARRSLAEQIRGTGQFLLRVGDGAALHAASVRALMTVAERRITGFAGASSEQRIASLARSAGLDSAALASAIKYAGTRRSNELRSAIALLEAARRTILRNDNRSTYGN
jgi:hypothetical protein